METPDLHIFYHLDSPLDSAEPLGPHTPVWALLVVDRRSLTLWAKKLNFLGFHGKLAPENSSWEIEHISLRFVKLPVKSVTYQVRFLPTTKYFHLRHPVSRFKEKTDFQGWQVLQKSPCAVYSTFLKSGCKWPDTGPTVVNKAWDVFS